MSAAGIFARLAALRDSEKAAGDARAGHVGPPRYEKHEVCHHHHTWRCRCAECVAQGCFEAGGEEAARDAQEPPEPPESPAPIPEDPEGEKEGGEDG